MKIQYKCASLFSGSRSRHKTYMISLSGRQSVVVQASCTVFARVRWDRVRPGKFVVRASEA